MHLFFVNWLAEIYDEKLLKGGMNGHGPLKMDGPVQGCNHNFTTYFEILF